jgi:hypothetical protein
VAPILFGHNRHDRISLYGDDRMRHDSGGPAWATQS